MISSRLEKSGYGPQVIEHGLTTCENDILCIVFQDLSENINGWHDHVLVKICVTPLTT